VILYHGSYVAVEKPQLSFSRLKTDFGQGFYTTPYREQAVKWAKRYKRFQKSGVITEFSFDDTAIESELISVLKFSAYSDEWLDFVTDCRKGLIVGDSYDLIIGSVANDKVFDAIEAYFNGFYSKEKAIEKLRYEEPNLQFCFKSQSAIDSYLKFIKSEEIK
jgi:hypothetical protein